METPIHLSAKGVDLSPDEEALLKRSAADIERFFGRLVACRIVVSVPHRRSGGEPVSWGVRLSLTVPGGELVVTRQAKPTFREAVDDAFDAARRQLQDWAREHRGDVKVHVDELHGRVSRLLRYEGYGFLTAPGGGEVYFHRNSVPDGGFDRLNVGTQVRFVRVEGEQGPQASTVVPLGHPARVGAAPLEAAAGETAGRS